MKARALVAALALHALAASAAPTCPATLESQQSLAAAPEGWSVVPMRQVQRLIGISVFDGPPSEGAELKPESSHGGQRQLWRFDTAAARGIWIGCRYDGSRLMLTRRIEPAPRICELITGGRVLAGADPSPLSFNCR
ncbi:STY0301 family protein [Niveibacterium sp.]|uniref:STY0301 family protein n=1 Tax=Niveibacterium sp. TaxID=2017444 RepID=UPI0035B35461